VRNPEALAGALIVLHDGSAASAHVDGNPEAARYARWAAEQLLDAHLPGRSTRRR
jgi:hypothetical protein